jgi:hypothetical protein
MAWIKVDPGPCPVDDMPHTTCTSADAGPPVVVQLPNRDGVVEALVGPAPVAPAAAAPGEPYAVGEPFTTATYRRARHAPKGRR